MLVSTDSHDWFGMAEQAIAAIYVLSSHPDVLCSEFLRQKTRLVFQQTRKAPSLSRPASPDPANTEERQQHTQEGADTAAATTPQETTNQKPSVALSQLLFAVGHIAIKQIVHLELCEMDFKRRKQEQEKSKPMANQSPRKSMGQSISQKRRRTVQGVESDPDKKKEEEKDELDMIGGTTEDDFTEAIAHIRERELLYGRNSLLANFGPLVTEICANNTAYQDQSLQAAATLCLAKLMCVSAEYC